MDRQELQQLAELRIDDAEVLVAAGRWQAAYYLLGYCVECALKAWVAKQFQLHEVPDRKLVNSFYTHRLDDLLTISGVRSDLEQQARIDPAFERNWNTVKDWSEAARYNAGVNESNARHLLAAVTDSESGILPWLKTHW